MNPSRRSAAVFDEAADVVLIYPYHYTHAPKAMLFHPLGIAQLAALLRQKGLVTRVIDCTFLQKENVIAAVVAARPKIIGIYIMLSMSANALELAESLRNVLPGVLRVCGGPLPTLHPERFSSAFDLVFRGEAAQSFPLFCADYLASDANSLAVDPMRYPGIYRSIPEGGVVSSPSIHSDEAAMDRMPIPDRDDYPHEAYQKFWRDAEGFSLAGIMTTFGCPFSCDFCSKPIYGNHFRRRCMDRIFEEIADIKQRGYDGLWIADDCFSLDPDHVRRFCRRLISEKLDMKWFCLARVDGISADDIALWEQAGCRKVFFGLESGDNRVLALMNKKTTTEMAERTLYRFSKSRIQTAGFFIVGYPGETWETIETTFAWALSLPLDELSFTVPYPLPGTPLYDRVGVTGNGADWNYENENRMVHASDFDEADLKARIESAYAAFDARRQTGPATRVRRP